MEARLSGLKSRCLGKSYTAVCCLGCVWSARSTLWVLFFAALALSGLWSEPRQICGEETRYHPWKSQVLFLLRRFRSNANKASWLSGERAHLRLWWRRFDSRFRCILLSLFHRGLCTEIGLQTPLYKIKHPVLGYAIPVSGAKPKRGWYVFWQFFKIVLCSAKSFKRSRRELLIDVRMWLKIGLCKKLPKYALSTI